jgi:hypothetical protein
MLQWPVIPEPFDVDYQPVVFLIRKSCEKAVPGALVKSGSHHESSNDRSFLQHAVLWQEPAQEPEQLVGRFSEIENPIVAVNVDLRALHLFVVLFRHDDERRGTVALGVLANTATNGQIIISRLTDDVNHDKIGVDAAALYPVESILKAQRMKYAIAVLAKVLLEGRMQVVVVVDEKDGRARIFR